MHTLSPLSFVTLHMLRHRVERAGRGQQGGEGVWEARSRREVPRHKVGWLFPPNPCVSGASLPLSGNQIVSIKCQENPFKIIPLAHPRADRFDVTVTSDRLRPGWE